MKFILFIILQLLLVTSCNSSKQQEPLPEVKTKPAAAKTAEIKNENPADQSFPAGNLSIKISSMIDHDNNAYTQGLIFHDGRLYESTGQYGESTLRRINPKTGEIEKKVKIEDKYFSEGIVLLNGKIYMLTWIARLGFIFDLNTLEKSGEFTYSGEGWGITTEGKYLIISDGSNVLKYLDPQTFREVKRVRVFFNGSPLNYINELEYINGEIHANLYGSDQIARIDPESGYVLGFIDLSPLKNTVAGYQNLDVLNGIAYDKDTKTYYVTGKNWPYIYTVDFNLK